MADDPNPQLRAEMNAALDVISPQIRGMNDLVSVSIADDLRALINLQITAREHRQTLIRAVITNLDATRAALAALNADGYPALDAVAVPPNAFKELKSEMSDLEAAAAVFKTDQAVRISIGLGNPVPKTD